MIGIYKITSPSGKIYIGQSIDIDKRWKHYKKHICSTREQPKLHNSFKKYGIKNHVFELVEECVLELLNERERYWQKFYDVLSENGLNCGYVKTDTQKYVHSEETKKKISKKMSQVRQKDKGVPRDKKTIKKMKSNHANYIGKNNPNYGKKCSKKAIHKTKKVNSKPLQQYDLENNLVKIWNSIRDVEIFYNKHKGFISKILKKNPPLFNGYLWKTTGESIEFKRLTRPSYTQLLNEVEEFGYSATGRKYGVSYNTIKGWIKYYEKKV